MAKQQRKGRHGMSRAKGSAGGRHLGGRKQTFTRAAQNLENDIVEQEGRIGQPRDTDDARPGGAHRRGRHEVHAPETLERGGAAMEIGPDSPRAQRARRRQRR